MKAVAKTEIKETETEEKPILLRFEIKIVLERFIEKYIVLDALCSERLNDVYKCYTEFSETNYPTIEIPKKRLFKLALKNILKSQGTYIHDYATNAGVTLSGIGLRSENIELNEMELNGIEQNGSTRNVVFYFNLLAYKKT